MKTGGANAAQGNDQIQPDARANFGNTHWSESCSATSMQWCNLNNICCMLQRTGDGEYEGGKRAMARLRGSGEHGSVQHNSGGDAARLAASEGDAAMRPESATSIQQCIGSRKAHGARSALVNRKNGLVPLGNKGLVPFGNKGPVPLGNKHTAHATSREYNGNADTRPVRWWAEKVRAQIEEQLQRPTLRHGSSRKRKSEIRKFGNPDMTANSPLGLSAARSKRK